MHFDFGGKVVIVTGGGGDIGRGIALALASAGARVLVNDRDLPRAEDVAAQIKSLGGEAMANGADITNVTEVEALVQFTLSCWGEIQVLVNNAGGIDDALLSKMSEAQWDAVMNLNLKAAFLCSRAAHAALKESGCGRIVNIASMAYRGNVGQSNYAAAKAGLVGLTRSLGLELARDGICVNCVAPGLIATPKAQTLPQPVRERLLASVPMRRMGEVDDIAGAVLFFASDAARYISRQVLHVAGGFEGF